MFPDGVIEDAAMVEWASQIQGLTRKHIDYAFEICFDHFPEWPPNPGEFRSLCKLADIEPDYKPPQIDNPSKPETVQSEIAKMRKLL